MADVHQPQWICISLNETHYYEIDPEDKILIKEINGIYFYDKNLNTFLCTSTPSYFLMALRNQVVCIDGVPEEIRDRLYEKYENAPMEDSYFECYGIDSISSDRKHEYDHPEKDKQVVREYYQGNWVL